MKKAKHIRKSSTHEHTGARMPVLTPAQFTQEVATALTQSAPNLKLRIIEALELESERLKTPPATINLQNAYQDYLHNPDQRADVIAAHVSAFLEIENIDFDAVIDRSRILPVLKHNSWLKQFSETASSAGCDSNAAPHQRLTEDIIVVYGEDRAKSIRFLRAQDLAALQVSVEELHRIALSNVKAIPFDLEVTEDNGVYQARADRASSTSVILIDEFWNLWPIKIPGQIVFAVPARGWLLMTSSEYPQGIQRLSALAKRIVTNCPYEVSSELLVRRQGKVVPYKATSQSR